MPNTEGCQEHKDTTIMQTYEEDSSPPPETPMEICSAILNGWGFTYHSAVDIAYNIISLKFKEAIHKAKVQFFYPVTQFLAPGSELTLNFYSKQASVCLLSHDPTVCLYN